MSLFGASRNNGDGRRDDVGDSDCCGVGGDAEDVIMLNFDGDLDEEAEEESEELDEAIGERANNMADLTERHGLSLFDLDQKLKRDADIMGQTSMDYVDASYALDLCSAIHPHDNGNLDHDADDEDEKQDDINVIIDHEYINEARNLQAVLSTNALDTMTRVSQTNGTYSFHDFDIEVKNEIQKLVRLSICPSTNKCVVVLVNNQLILVPVTERISDRLAAYIWPLAKPYVKSVLPFCEEFNQLLVLPRNARPTRTETFAIFGVKYNKTNYSYKASVPREWRNRRRAGSTTSATTISAPGRSKQCISGLYQYCDFALVIVANNRVVDYAIHGVRSNISRLIEIYQPRRVYYNAQPGDALHVFMNYEYQPFYECTKNISRAVQIHRGNDTFNTLPFCERHDAFCALCCALRDTRGFIKYSDVPSGSIRMPQNLTNFILLPSTRTQDDSGKRRSHLARNNSSGRLALKSCRRSRRYDPYQQPTHNSRRLPLRMTKKSGRQ